MLSNVSMLQCSTTISICFVQLCSKGEVVLYARENVSLLSCFSTTLEKSCYLMLPAAIWHEQNYSNLAFYYYALLAAVDKILYLRQRNNMAVNLYFEISCFNIEIAKEESYTFEAIPARGVTNCVWMAMQILKIWLMIYAPYQGKYKPIL